MAVARVGLWLVVSAVVGCALSVVGVTWSCGPHAVGAVVCCACGWVSPVCAMFPLLCRLPTGRRWWQRSHRRGRRVGVECQLGGGLVRCGGVAGGGRDDVSEVPPSS